MKGALDVHRELLTRDVPHDVVRLRTAVLSADDLPRVLALEPAACVAVRCYTVSGFHVPGVRAAGAGAAGVRPTDRRERPRFAAVMVRAGDTPDPSALLDALGATAIRPASALEVNAATDYAALLVCPVGLPGDVTLLADSALVADSDVLYTPLGEGRVALGIRTRDLLACTGARVATLTSHPLRVQERSGWDGHVDLAELAEQSGQVIDLDRRSRQRPGGPRHSLG